VSNFVDVAIIGAGPYGLSVAAHLRALGVEFRIFGKPMELWRNHVPDGMRLKSDGSSSDLADAASDLTLKKYCAEAGIEHDDHRAPVTLDTFLRYSAAFQNRFVPEVEPKLLVAMEKTANAYALRFDDQDMVIARRVVLAVGIQHFAHLPDFLAGLPPELVSHSSRYGRLDGFVGRETLVMGAGASAIDIAGLLTDRGAEVSLMMRRPSFEFHTPPGERSLLSRLRRPSSPMGAGWQLRLFGDEPRLFYAMPQALRRRQARALLGPSAGWFMKDSIVGRVPILTGHFPHRAEIRGDRLHVRATTLDGGETEIVTSHLIAGTGYRIDLRRLGFLAPLYPRMRVVEQAPVLSTHFESSLRGLYFVGFASLPQFGPSVRFLCGTRYTARRTARHLEASLVRRMVSVAGPVSINF
jgi:thioredoxin reductase